MFGIIFDEARKIARNPKRLGQVFHLRRWRQFFNILLFRARTGNRWLATPGEMQFKQREYSSYEEYIRHQQSKFACLDLRDYDVNYRRLLKERLPPFLKKGMSVLCLGARQGTEVKAFHDLGCFAVGVDLNPGKDNPFVLPGDFHDLQFPGESVDVVFTNSLDHAFDVPKLLSEIRRVLKPGGLLIIEAIRGEAEANAPDHYASFWWRRVDDLADLLTRNGFKSLRRVAFPEPWPGEQISFSKTLLP